MAVTFSRIGNLPRERLARAVPLDRAHAGTVTRARAYAFRLFALDLVPGPPVGFILDDLIAAIKGLAIGRGGWTEHTKSASAAAESAGASTA